MGSSDKTDVDVSDDARKCTIFDEKSATLCFGDLLDQQTTATDRILVIFIRHFFCGNCQEYIRRLSTDLGPSVLPKDLSVVVIGCGAASLISSYVELTGCPFPIYADPSTNLYKALGMHRSLSLGRRGPDYIRHSLASGMVKSIVQGLKRIPTGDVMQAGDLDVNGGEFLMERARNFGHETSSAWDISWSHCMVNTRDHTEIPQLKRVLGIDQDNGHSRSTRAESDSAIPRRSMSARRRSWMLKTGITKRSASMNRTAVHAT